MATIHIRSKDDHGAGAQIWLGVLKNALSERGVSSASLSITHAPDGVVVKRSNLGDAFMQAIFFQNKMPYIAKDDGTYVVEINSSSPLP